MPCNGAAPTVGILLAAGLSTRMGSPKALLDWHGEPLVAYQARQLLLGGCDDVLVVTGHAAAAVEAAVTATGCRTVFNPEYREGRSTSVRAAALHIDGTPAQLVVLNVDQPRHGRTIRAVVDQHAGSDALITVPAFSGRRGHPVVFAGSLLPEILTISEETEGLRAVVHRHRTARQEVPMETDEVLIDLNEPADYRRVHDSWAM